MVPKLEVEEKVYTLGFRAVLFRMVPKQLVYKTIDAICFRAVLFRMVPKREHGLLV